MFAGETEVLGENLPSATLSTINPTWIDPGANPGLRGERPAANRLSHGTALSVYVIHCNVIYLPVHLPTYPPSYQRIHPFLFVCLSVSVSTYSRPVELSLCKAK
jgi:hypothetical protein